MSKREGNAMPKKHCETIDNKIPRKNVKHRPAVVWLHMMSCVQYWNWLFWPFIACPCER